MLSNMKRPKAILEPNNEQYEMYSVDSICDHDGDGARQHIATIYDHEEAAEMLRLWNSKDNVKVMASPLKTLTNSENESN